ncbi:MAG: DNA mismatch repair protein MutS [Chloroflexi bacterium]|nr:DNA mismatch repair protein MutS [Chloroflexota bacterium]
MPGTTDSLTPVRGQYLQVKRRYPDAVVFFRLGDFYETFDQDAHTVAAELDVVLTSRNVAKGQRIPMAGVPHHAAEGYIAKLIAKGYKVAICEQVAREAVNGLMPREVVRVVTPGTVVEPGMLADRRNNYLAALVVEEGAAGIAHVDITTGEFATTELSGVLLQDDVVRELDRLAPAELIVSDGGERFAGQGQEETTEAVRRHPHLAPLGVPVTLYDDWRFEIGNSRQALLDHFRVLTLAGYGCDDQPLATRAAGVLLQYLQANQPAALAQLNHLSTYAVSEFMTLDVATRRALELTETIRDRSARGSLLGVLDQTVTPMGARLLRRWMTQPLLSREALEARLSAVDGLYRDLAGRTALRGLLKGLGDLERLTNRIIQGVALPREVAHLAVALERVNAVAARLAEVVAVSDVPGVAAVYPLDGSSIRPCDEACELVSRALVDDPPAVVSSGGVFRPGYSQELDSIAVSVAESKRWVANLERLERERTGIRNLKVGYNKVFGYYLELTKSTLAAAPAEYIRKQTLVNAERYITPELKEHEAHILNAAEHTQELETRLYRELLQQLAGWADVLLADARALAHLDVFLALAEVAAIHRYVRPVLHEGRELHIVDGRHPVVELALGGAPFTPNDTGCAPESAIHIITGPNMSGKSTYLRQVALITLMAQIGSFVPARSASIGLVDRIFTRVGAQDEIAAGQSTFMVEMTELANILNHATARSLVILDEIGRGTSTYDGISIAWAVVEYLHNHPTLRPKTLFATHYHELTDLEGFLPCVRNYNVAVTRQGKDVVFTHHIAPGGADRSYGIHVGRLAGLPQAVTRRAEEILHDLEEAAQRVPAGTGRRVVTVKQLALFDAKHPVVDELARLDISSMSPLEAINKLYELQNKAK